VLTVFRRLLQLPLVLLLLLLPIFTVVEAASYDKRLMSIQCRLVFLEVFIRLLVSHKQQQFAVVSAFPRPPSIPCRRNLLCQLVVGISLNVLSVDFNDAISWSQSDSVSR
jgi:hypothetical protein